MRQNFAVIIPMANEEKDFQPFVNALIEVLNQLECGLVYFIVDKASKDRTLQLCQQTSSTDARFVTVWAPETRNVVEAYICGYQVAAKAKHDFIIEMDAGLSHDPNAIPRFLSLLLKDYDCVFGSRFITGGAIIDSNWERTFLSRVGTSLSNLLLGTKMHDMTSGFQGFSLEIVKKFLAYNLLSEAHFYQTELRYLLRKTRFVEVPIQYRAPSPRVSGKAILNSIYVLLHYVGKRVAFKAPSIK
ncbi:glycosyltransferase [Pontibacter sp. BT731]|uniref:glycosyltransferase n=1 Tax=Pontibacter coccineus TaxID=3063328 RepID=UPI0026E17DA6|nr:glycosyltransferase [Pontibacter sp. BT731]MDO6389177.1 glycosyltransferase [Pontibacter sp. BT731]